MDAAGLKRRARAWTWRGVRYSGLIVGAGLTVLAASLTPAMDRRSGAAAGDGRRQLPDPEVLPSYAETAVYVVDSEAAAEAARYALSLEPQYGVERGRRAIILVSPPLPAEAAAMELMQPAFLIGPRVVDLRRAGPGGPP